MVVGVTVHVEHIVAARRHDAVEGGTAPTLADVHRADERHYPLPMAGIGAPELIIILVIVLLVFGSTKLPKLARSLGEAQREFRKGQDESKDEETTGD